MKIFRRLVVTLFFIQAFASAAAPSFNMPGNGRFILEKALGAQLLSQCSRPSPGRISEFWEPSEREIEEMETSLTKFLDDREKAGKENPPKSATYHRQYVGIVMRAGLTIKSERYIYGNFYPAEDSLLYDPRTGKRTDETRIPIAVCDGGPVFWGIVYRVSTKTFEEPKFNGLS